MKAGETVRGSCNGCDREWDISLEPKAKGLPKEVAAIIPVLVMYCPFCGSGDIDTEEE